MSHNDFKIEDDEALVGSDFPFSSKEKDCLLEFDREDFLDEKDEDEESQENSIPFNLDNAKYNISLDDRI